MKKVIIVSSFLSLLAVTAGAQLRQQLLNRLSAIQTRGYMVGHQDDPFYGMDWNGDLGRSDVKDAVGDYPAVMGFELGGIEMDDEKNLDSVPFTRIRQELIAHVERGGIVAVSWHPRNPYTGGTAWDNADNVVVKGVLPGGSQHLKFLNWMKRVGRFLKTLRTANDRPVPIIFRPWHENNGDWFWWGNKQCTSEEFHALWCMLQDYLRSEGFENLVWSWSPNLGVESTDLNYYPGDDRVDLIGLDAYQWGTEADYVRQLNADLELLTDFAKKHGKLLALTECGLQNLPDPTWWTRVLKPVLDKYPVVYFLPWRNNGQKEYYGPAPGQENTRYFKEMISDPRVLMLQDIIR